MADQTMEDKDITRTARVVPVLAAVVTWLVWRFGVEALVFAPDVTTTLLGLSVAANVGLIAYLTTSRR